MGYKLDTQRSRLRESDGSFPLPLSDCLSVCLSLGLVNFNPLNCAVWLLEGIPTYGQSECGLNCMQRLLQFKRSLCCILADSILSHLCALERPKGMGG